MAVPVRYETSDGVARLTLSRVDVRNALDLEMLEELDRRIQEAEADGSVRLLLLAADGPAFCAGMNLKSVDLGDPTQARAFAQGLSDVYRRLVTFPKPLLCAVDGPVSGGGVGLVAAADLVWAAPEATFSLPETRLGLVPALVSVPLHRRVGTRMLGNMALGGVPLDALPAVARGLADFATEGSAMEAALDFASDLLRDHAPDALSRTKRFLVELNDGALEQRLAAAEREFEGAVATAEARRG
ncbi:MAG: enoyl-CoA hydratase/isomerase family protein, partial [Gemmatimonadota bacterium]